MSATAATLLPSSQRPIPLSCRRDLRAERIEYQGKAYWVLKDPVALKYHRLQSEQYVVLRSLDGSRSLEAIRKELNREFPTLSFTLTDVQHLVADLHDKGLINSERPGRGPLLLKQRRKRRRQNVLRAVRNILYIRLPGWDPEPTLQKLYPLTRWMFRPWAVATALLLVASSLLLLAVQFNHFRGRLPEFQQFFGWPNLIYLWVTLGAAKIVHEFGHGVACKHYGGECHEMGMMLLVFTPCLYCDASDSWMLRNKWSRIIIGGAGMAVELVLSALAIFVWWFTQPGLLHHLALNAFFITTITTIIFNANPLMRFDGYYMLSDLLEIPNLRPKADRMLREKFAWYCLGIELPQDPFMPERGRAWFVIYSIAAAVYRWFILFAITLFLYTVLKPYGLQSVGITLAVVSVGAVVGNLAYSVYRIVTAPRSEPMSYTKAGIALGVLVCLALAALAVPLPLHVEAPFSIEPHAVEHVYATTPGRLVELNVEPGQRVETSASGGRHSRPLVRLANYDMRDHYRSLKVQRDVQKIEVELYRALDDVSQLRLAVEKLQSLESQLAELEKQLDDLVIEASRSGVVVAPPRVAEPTLDEGDGRPTGWHGTPLDPRNQGCWIEQGTHLFSIAPDERLDAVLLIDQADRDNVRQGETRVELKFEHLPERTYTGVIEQISDRQVDYAPEALSNKFGGALGTVTDPQGRQRLPSSAYQARVVLCADTHLLRPGLRGNARFLVDERSAWDWIWRYLRRTFHFRL